MAVSIAELAQSYLDNYDYHQAVKFIQDYGNPTVAKMLASMSRTSFTESKVEKELERLASKKDKIYVDSITIDVSEVNKTQPSDYRTGLINHRNQLVRKLDYLSGTLDHLDSQEARKKTAFEILDLEDELRIVWEHIDYYDAHGEQLPSLPESELDKVFHGVATVEDLIKIRNNHRTYISRIRAGKRKGDIAFHESVIREVERRKNG